MYATAEQWVHNEELRQGFRAQVAADVRRLLRKRIQLSVLEKIGESDPARWRVSVQPTVREDQDRDARLFRVMATMREAPMETGSRLRVLLASSGTPRHLVVLPKAMSERELNRELMTATRELGGDRFRFVPATQEDFVSQREIEWMAEAQMMASGHWFAAGEDHRGPFRFVVDPYEDMVGAFEYLPAKTCRAIRRAPKGLPDHLHDAWRKRELILCDIEETGGADHAQDRLSDWSLEWAAYASTFEHFDQIAEHVHPESMAAKHLPPETLSLVAQLLAGTR